MGIGAAKFVTLLASGGGAASVGTSPGTTNLVGWWKMDESSGNALDAHSSSLDLTDTNTVTANASGKVNGSRVFTSANAEYFTRASETALQAGDIDFCWFGWVKFTTIGTTNSMFYKWVTGGNQRAYALHYSDGGGAFQWILSSDGTSGTISTLSASTFGTASTDTWYFLYVEYNAATNLMGISVNNGTLDTLSHAGGAFATSTAALFLADNGGSSALLNGEMDEWAYYKNRILTADERTWAYNEGNGRTYGDL